MAFTMIGGRSLAQKINKRELRFQFIRSSDLKFKKDYITNENILLASSPYLASARKNVDFDLGNIADCLFSIAQNKTLIYLSSASVYGHRILPIPFREEDSLIGSTPYALEKISFEKLLLSNLSLFKRLVILRVSGIFDDKDDENCLNLLNRLNLLEKNPLLPALAIDNNGRQIRDFCSLSYLIKVVKFFFKNETVENLFNISDSRGYTIREICISYLERGLSKDKIEFLVDRKKKIHSFLDTSRIESLIENDSKKIKGTIYKFLN